MPETCVQSDSVREALMELSKSMLAQMELYQELAALISVEDGGTNKTGRTLLSNTPFLTGVILETLRLHPNSTLCAADARCTRCQAQSCIEPAPSRRESDRERFQPRRWMRGFEGGREPLEGVNDCRLIEEVKQALVPLLCARSFARLVDDRGICEGEVLEAKGGAELVKDRRLPGMDLLRQGPHACKPTDGPPAALFNNGRPMHALILRSPRRRAHRRSYVQTTRGGCRFDARVCPCVDMRIDMCVKTCVSICV